VRNVKKFDFFIKSYYIYRKGVKMLTIKKQTAEAGIEYFRRDDNNYYVVDGEFSRWHGKGAESLGLDKNSEILHPDFKCVMEGYHPKTQEPLAKSVKDKDRRAFYDFTFSAPKAVSILACGEDRERIIEAHNIAVKRALEFIEMDYAYTRQAAKKGDKKMATVKTDNLIIAQINHMESREGEPQLHAHCPVANMTMGMDGKWRTLVLGKVFDDKAYLAQIYRSELAAEMRKLGYGITIPKKYGDVKRGYFSISGVSDEVCDEFSTRRKQILAKVKEYEDKKIPTKELYERLKKMGIHVPKDGEYLSDEAQKQLACLETRKSKNSKTIEKIQENVESRLAELHQSLSGISEQALSATTDTPPRTMAECIQQAVSDIIEKESVLTEAEVIRHALRDGLGYYTADQLIEEYYRQPNIIRLGNKGRYGREYQSTSEMIETERRIVEIAQAGIGRSTVAIKPKRMGEYLTAMKERLASRDMFLSQGQEDTIVAICTSQDTMVLVQGDAGAGKTTAMVEVKNTLNAEGITVRGFAPTGKASQELGEAGVDAITLDKFITPNSKHQLEVGDGEVWIVDEAGMIGSKKMKKFLDIATQKNAKIVLVGDSKQFRAVDQGKIFKELQDQTEVTKTEITEVKRQITPHAQKMVAAVKALNIPKAIDIIDQQGQLHVIEDNENRFNGIVEEFLSDKKENINSVVLTSGNADRQEINKRIRARLASDGIITGGGTFNMFDKCEIDGISRKYAQSYTPKQVLVFKKSCPGIPNSKGVQATILSTDCEKNTIKISYYNKLAKHYDSAEIDLNKHSSAYDIFNVTPKDFGVGDVIMFGKNDAKIGVSNGQTGTIIALRKDGTAQIQIGKTKMVECNLANRGSRAYNYIDHAYCLTNHKSQGSTYDKTIINADVAQANNFNAFYVQVTRARKDTSLYTNNKTRLVEQAQVEQEKQSTLDPLLDIRTEITQGMAKFAQTSFSVSEVFKDKPAPVPDVTTPETPVSAPIPIVDVAMDEPLVPVSTPLGLSSKSEEYLVKWIVMDAAAKGLVLSRGQVIDMMDEIKKTFKDRGIELRNLTEDNLIPFGKGEDGRFKSWVVGMVYDPYNKVDDTDVDKVRGLTHMIVGELSDNDEESYRVYFRNEKPGEDATYACVMNDDGKPHRFSGYDEACEIAEESFAVTFAGHFIELKLEEKLEMMREVRMDVLPKLKSVADIAEYAKKGYGVVLYPGLLDIMNTGLKNGRVSVSDVSVVVYSVLEKGPQCNVVFDPVGLRDVNLDDVMNYYEVFSVNGGAPYKIMGRKVGDGVVESFCVAQNVRDVKNVMPLIGSNAASRKILMELMVASNYKLTDEPVVEAKPKPPAWEMDF